MRIIAGTLGGRQFDSPKNSKTHPMSDKMRGAIFNVLGDIESLTVLDAFAGSGALGLEALSRGAAHVTYLEHDNSAARTIAHNIEALAVQNRAKLIRINVVTWLKTGTEKTFDVVLCDPPYDNLQLELLEKLAACVKLQGMVVFSLPPSASVPLMSHYQLLVNKLYGDGRLVFYRKTE